MKLVRQPSRPFEVFELDVMALSFEMDFSLTVVETLNYSFFDTLAEIGGLYAAVTLIIAIILSAVNYNNLDTHLISQLYSFYDKGRKEKTFYKSSIVGNLADFLIEKFPQRCQNCLASKRMKELKAAKEQLRKETCIVELVRKLRFIEQIFELVPLADEKNEHKSECS